VTERRAPKYPLVRAVADEVGEIRAPSRDELRVQRRVARAVDLGREPRAQGFEVDAVGCVAALAHGR
jgi:hypothetical protein